LLRAVQRQDTPPELMAEESPGSMFPHRLGLSGVIDEQIRQFRRRARWRRRVDKGQVRALLELIARRSDAREVFSAAGRELASIHFSGPLGRMRRFARRLPETLRRRAALRALRKANDAFTVAADTTVNASPLQVRATDSLTAQVGGAGLACQVYASLAANTFELIGGLPMEVAHTSCQALGDEACVWELSSRQ
jgi:predicted hydrocarbon binding protein